MAMLAALLMALARTTLEEALAETVIEGLLEIEERGVLLRSHGI